MKKIKWEIIIPIILAIVLVAVFVYLDYKDKIPGQGSESDSGPQAQGEPIPPSENPRRNEQVDFGTYGCAGPGSINITTSKPADSVWKISKKTNTISLGKYRIDPPAKTILDIPKLWLYFFSEDLGREDDNLYGLESSYVSGISLMVNGHKQEIKLGGDEYMFIELDNYPLGDYYPYEDVDLEFEFLIELKDKEEKSLDYINGADVQAQIRVFAVGCEEFTQDIVIDANFEL
jgi:hypothetical protein